MLNYYKKEEVDANYKYVIQSKGVNDIELVKDIEQIGKGPEGQTLVTYVPLRQTAESFIDKKGDRRIKGLGGERHPAKVIISYQPEPV